MITTLRLRIKELQNTYLPDLEKLTLKVTQPVPEAID
jgi:hypothetical protein